MSNPASIAVGDADFVRPMEMEQVHTVQHNEHDGLERDATLVTIGYGDLNESGNVVFSWRRLLLFAGPGLLMSVAYVDPGNLEADLQTGFTAGYTLGWIVIVSTFLGFVVQLMSMRLGVVTSRHLAEHCHDVYPPLPRVLLWLMMEIAIIGSDIQEVIGSAIAIQLLSHGSIPLWGGVVITGVDTFFLLLLERLGVRKLEAFFGVLVATMTVSFMVMYNMAGVPTSEVLKGALLPTIEWDYLSIAAGMVGALVMPHNIFLHSALVQSRKIDLASTSAKREAILYNAIESAISLGITVVINLSLMAVFASGFHGRDIIKEVGLMTAGEHLGERFGPAMTYIWAIGLVAAGQSSTMTGTYTGQFVMSGFMKIQVPPWQRAIITRTVALAPTLVVAVIFAGTEKLDILNQALNVLQSVQLPFALIPVLYVSTRADIMGETFVVQSWFRVAIEVICWLLLMLNLCLVVSSFISGVAADFGLAVVIVAVAVAYVLFVIYLLVGPSRVYDSLKGCDSKLLQLLNSLFGQQPPDSLPHPSLVPVCSTHLLGSSFEPLDDESGMLHDGKFDDPHKTSHISSTSLPEL